MSNIRTIMLLTGALCIIGCYGMSVFAAGQAGGSAVIIRDFVPSQGICRAKRPIDISAVLENKGESTMNVQPRLSLPKGVRMLHSDTKSNIRLESAQVRHISWRVEAQKPADYTFKLELLSDGKVVSDSSLDLHFFESMSIKKLPYIPDPQPVKTTILVGAHNCPLWEAEKPGMWAQVRKHPERTPALGFYSQENPEVADWETKWAVEHGVSFFIYCWYRTSQGEPVKMMFSSAIHDALLKSRFKDKLKFTIMWENQRKGFAGVSDENDLMTNLMPFWIDNYFKNPGYLKVDNKPVLFIYRPEFLVKDLGSVENVKKAFAKMRQACVDAGFAGLHILGEYRGVDPNMIGYLKQLGVDYTFAYVWPVPDSPPPDKAVEIQMGHIKKTQEIGILPQVVTVSQAWSGWRDEGSIWKIPPTQFEGLLRQAKDFISTFPASELGSKMLLLDNWNEWSEGHYILPYREYGFGYLDAVRKVFSDAPEKHVDLIPEDIGFGPYDRPYKEYMQEQEKLQQLSIKKAHKAGADEPGLVAWWAFDEKDDSPVALDYSGHRLGGSLNKASRAKGIDGNALDCQGGCVSVAANEKLTLANAMTVECWVRTDTSDQNNVWIAGNCRDAAGYGLGMSHGKPSFTIPIKEWKPMLEALTVLPMGKWVHLAGTYDGKTMRIYVNGEECGSMDRGGPVNPSTASFSLGSFAAGHEAHFTGLLDEVKLYDRALSASELRAHEGAKCDTAERHFRIQ